MDPNATLNGLRDALRGYHDALDAGQTMAAAEHADDAIELAEALDEWLAKGGFPPAAWTAMAQRVISHA